MIALQEISVTGHIAVVFQCEKDVGMDRVLCIDFQFISSYTFTYLLTCHPTSSYLFYSHIK